jgi:hypothetical protein
MNSSLREMNERRQQWMNEKPTGDFGNELRFRKDDIALVQFATTGDDGDVFFSVYRSHIFPTITRNGQRGSVSRYCPVQSGEINTPCPFCEQQHDDIKERMSMWFWVTNILHAGIVQDKQFPQVPYQSKYYFNEEVNNWRLWHTSAWKESPFTDIIKLYEIYKGLHNFVAQLEAVGDGINRRYKLIALPNTQSLSNELYERAKQECQPIRQMLLNQIGQPVQTNQNSNTVATNQPPSTLIQPFNAPGAVTETVFNILGNTVPTEPSKPIEPPAPPVMPSKPEEQPQQVEQPPTNDEPRPIKSLF